MPASKQDQGFLGRTFYRASGGVRLAVFLFWLLPAFGAAALLAGFLFWLFLNGFYYLVIVPAIVAFGVGFLVRLAVVKGHCRNWLVGGLAGLCAAIVLYFGYFYMGMLYHWGSGRLDLLPTYIDARMKTDVIRDTNHSGDSPTHSPGMNWFMFTFEAAAVFLIGIVPAVQRSRKPYCEACGRWMARRVTTFSPNASRELLDTLRSGSSQEFAALCAKPVYVSLPNVSLGIDACPSLNDGVSRGCPVYISVKQVIQSQGMTKADPLDQARGKMLLRALQATSSELSALAHRFKALENAVGKSVVAAPLPAKTTSPGAEGFPIEIKDVEPEYAGKVATRGMMWSGTILTFVPLLTFFAGMGLMLWAITILEVPVSAAEKFFAYGMIAVAIVFILGGIIVALRNPSFVAIRILQKRLRGELGRRPNRLVDPGNPEALVVEIVPKANWGKVMLYLASDVGLLLRDRSRRQLLFEGDRGRFRVPVDALTYCALEEFVYYSGHARIRYYYVVLRIENPTQFWEAPIRLQTGGGLGSRKRKKEMTLLFDRIEQLRRASQSVAT